MNAFKRIALATIVATAALALTACSAGTDGDASTKYDENIKSYAVTLPSGTEVDCVVFEEYRRGGVSCFWGEKSTAKETTIYLHTSVGTAAGAERVCVVFSGHRAGGIDCNTSDH